MARLDDLEVLRGDLLTRMDACTSDQNFSVMGRLLVDVLKQIEELGGESADAKVSGLSDFEKRLRDREAKTARRAAVQ